MIANFGAPNRAKIGQQNHSQIHKQHAEHHNHTPQQISLNHLIAATEPIVQFGFNLLRMVVVSSCLCCGTNAAQARIARGAFTAAPSAPVDEVMVVCLNPRCRGKQRFQCAMLFCDRAFPEIPKTVQFDHPWMNQMMPYYRQKLQPSEDVYVNNCIQCCIQCCLSKQLLIKLR